MTLPHAIQPIGLMACFLGLASASGAQPVPSAVLITVGPGASTFSKFGHAALCVFTKDYPEGGCFNYGTADFTTPGPLTWDVLRGRARFWVSTAPYEPMLRFYRTEDRTIYQQVLPLDENGVRELAEALRVSALPENRDYLYDHFDDNCATRPRDHIDAATDGVLRRESRNGLGSFRTHLRRGLTEDPFLQLAGELLLGRHIDRPITEWQSMFLPRNLRSSVSRHLNAPAAVLYERQASVGGWIPKPGPPWLWSTGALALVVGAGILIGPTAMFAILRVVSGATLGLLATTILILAIASPLPELRYNELLLVVVPSDLLLITTRRAPLARYATLRLAGLLAVTLLLATQVLVQPLWPAVVLVAVIMAALRTRLSR